MSFVFSYSKQIETNYMATSTLMTVNNIFEENIQHCCNESFKPVKLSRARASDKIGSTAAYVNVIKIKIF